MYRLRRKLAGSGVSVRTVRASGGGAKSSFWRQVLADVFGKPVSTLETQEGSAYGAALLAMVGTGAFSSVEEACRNAVAETSISQPEKFQDDYRLHHKTYTSLYPALKGLFPQMTS